MPRSCVTLWIVIHFVFSQILCFLSDSNFNVYNNHVNQLHSHITFLRFEMPPNENITIPLQQNIFLLRIIIYFYNNIYIYLFIYFSCAIQCILSKIGFTLKYAQHLSHKTTDVPDSPSLLWRLNAGFTAPVTFSMRVFLHSVVMLIVACIFFENI